MDKLCEEFFNGLTSEVHVYDTLDSTNDTAKAMAKEGAEHGTTVIADTQTKGRGRYGRSFHSPSGSGIYMSTIVYPHELGLSDPTLITIHAAVAVREAIEITTGKQAGIKWLNDLFLEGKKICGVLVETAGDAMIVGIGINFRRPLDGFGGELEQIAGAIFDTHEKREITRNHLVAEVLMKTATPFVNSGLGGLIDEYKRHLAMPVLGQPYGDDGGTALDIDRLGRLVVQKNDGEIIALNL
ncbi:MAG: biotin--[acetyl-CoA-carboxylase] ligase [Defluviitaleaceae bacterium]|nr:biotin--[acetyl-CoA-carboxylase] ligase [Defluviitaleaceae bacterium]